MAPDQVQYVIMGQVLTAGAGQIPARQAAHKAGIPLTVPALTINKVCLSGIDAIALADQLIRAGEFDVVVAGGQESMSQAPHLLPKSREGFKYGTVELADHMALDGLWDVLTDQAMGGLTEAANAGDQQFSRTEQDAFAARSHQLRRRGLEERPVRRRGGAGADPAAQGRAAGVPRWTRASGPTPAWRRWPGCGRRSGRTAPSPPGPPRRSRTAPPRWW